LRIIRGGVAIDATGMGQDGIEPVARLQDRRRGLPGQAWIFAECPARQRWTVRSTKRRTRPLPQRIIGALLCGTAPCVEPPWGSPSGRVEQYSTVVS
jgi:hypothetical protein